VCSTIWTAWSCSRSYTEKRRGRKGQRNTQQVKKQDKCPPNQTKEEEIGILPDKEFLIMIVKMIQNLEIKMESQINSLDTKIEKMQERLTSN